MREELMQGWVERPDRDRPAVHRFEDAFEIAALIGEKLVEGLPPSFHGRREDHFPHRIDTFTLEEHVLGAAKTYPLGAERNRFGGFAGFVCIGAHAKLSG